MTTHDSTYISLHGAKYLRPQALTRVFFLMRSLKTEQQCFCSADLEKMPSYMHKTGRTSPPVHLAFDLLLFLFSRRLCPFFFSTVPISLLFPHEAYFQYACHRHAHQRGCYARARRIPHCHWNQFVSAEICQGLHVTQC
jgi:hypothetical protein